MPAARLHPATDDLATGSLAPAAILTSASLAGTSTPHASLTRIAPWTAASKHCERDLYLANDLVAQAFISAAILLAPKTLAPKALGPKALGPKTVAPISPLAGS